MKRLVIAMVAGLLVLSSCGGGSETTSSTSAAATSSTAEAPSPTTTPPTTSAPTTSTTAAPPPEPQSVFPPDPYADLPAIVTAADAVYEVAPDGAARRLLSGKAAVAIDDTRGGLLYQIDRGRDWDGTASLDTRIWWLPAGSTQPQELLVPTRAEGHELSLHDVYHDDGIHIIYIRHEGDRSLEQWPFNANDRLRSFDVAGRTSTDLIVAAAWEAGIDDIQCGSNLVAYSDINQIGTNCEFIDHRGVPVSIPADVEPPDCEIECRRSCAIGWDGELLMYSKDHFASPDTVDGAVVLFVDARTGEEKARVFHTNPSLPEFVDLLGNRVLLSWSNGPAVIYDMAQPEQGPLTLPVSGMARFAKSPIELPDTVPIG